MFEKLHQPLAPRSKYVRRLIKCIMLGLALIAIVELIGMLGYREFEGMPWIDAFANAAMILASMGPFGPLQTSAGKIFAGFYALFCGLMFIFIIGVVFAPVIHRFIHSMHIEDEPDSKRRK